PGGSRVRPSPLTPPAGDGHIGDGKSIRRGVAVHSKHIPIIEYRRFGSATASHKRPISDDPTPRTTCGRQPVIRPVPDPIRLELRDRIDMAEPASGRARHPSGAAAAPRINGKKYNLGAVAPGMTT